MRVPSEFQRPIKVAYPDGNRVIFEQWLMSQVVHPEYLPINWCGYFVNHNYGNDKAAMFRLNKFLKTLDASKRYWTVTQYDLGIIADISHLNIKVFGSGGGGIDFPIPLICHPHGRLERTRSIFANFIGSKTHPVRVEIIDTLKKNSDYVVSFEKHSIDFLSHLHASSIFSICPRGFGPTSFRICEALEQNSIPVYISDHWIVPGNIDFNEYGVLVHSDEIRNLDKILKGFTQEQIRSKQEAGREIYNRIYTFSGCKQLILDNL
jgi:hypothetical protein